LCFLCVCAGRGHDREAQRIWRAEETSQTVQSELQSASSASPCFPTPSALPQLRARLEAKTCLLCDYPFGKYLLAHFVGAKHFEPGALRALMKSGACMLGGARALNNFRFCVLAISSTKG